MLQITEAKELQGSSVNVSTYIKDVVKKRRIELETEVVKTLNQATMALKAQAVEAAKCDAAWAVFDRVFTKVFNLEIHMEAAADAKQQKAVPREDAWLAEKRYLRCEEAAQTSLTKAVGDVHQFTAYLQNVESQRAKWVQEVVQNIISKSVLRVAAANHNNCSAALSNIECFDARQCSMIHLLNGFLSNINPTDMKAVSASLSTEQAKAMAVPPAVSPYMSESARLVQKPPLPKEGSILVHETAVTHPVGMLGRFKPGVLVFTSDRFLHMMESKTNVTPFWTVDCDLSAISLLPGKKGSTLQIQEMRPGLGGKKKYQVKAVESELINWMEVLKKHSPNSCSAEAQAKIDAVPEVAVEIPEEPLPEEEPSAPLASQDDLLEIEMEDELDTYRISPETTTATAPSTARELKVDTRKEDRGRVRQLA
eukprot:Platyproteum_vivax@DN5959_c0_g1_i1.p1